MNIMHDVSTKRATAIRVLEAESDAIRQLVSAFPEQFDAAADLLATVQGKIICAGIGKSGIVARKFCATLCSFGFPSVSLCVGDALHGDAGVIASGDALVIVSHSGASSELEALGEIARVRNVPVVGVLGSADRQLARICSLIIHTPLKETACPYALAPMAITTATIALLDALVAVVALERQVTSEDFAAHHPAGQLGRKLHQSVGKCMIPIAKTPKLSLNATISDALLEMCRCEIGAACVVDHNNALLGFLTDGDVRRALVRGDTTAFRIDTVMIKAPKCLSPSTSIKDAIALMEDRLDRFYVAPVVDEHKVLQGIIRLHELIG